MRVLIFAGLALLAMPASAQSLKSFTQCAAIVDDGKRLECYDKAASAVSPAIRAEVEQRQKLAAARAAEAAAAAEAAREAQERDRFGREGVRGFRGTDQEVTEIQSTVTEVLRDSGGKMIIVLDNGQMWRQIDGSTMASIRTGSTVTVKRGTLGSYRLAPEKGNRTFQVVRMR